MLARDRSRAFSSGDSSPKTLWRGRFITIEGGEAPRFERLDLALHENLRQGFRQTAGADSARCILNALSEAKASTCRRSRRWSNGCGGRVPAP